jgi:hypothetical protein
MKWAEHVAHMGEMRNVYKIVARKPVTSSSEYSNEPLSSIKGWEFLDQLSDYYLSWKDSIYSME